MLRPPIMPFAREPIVRAHSAVYLGAHSINELARSLFRQPSPRTANSFVLRGNSFRPTCQHRISAATFRPDDAGALKQTRASDSDILISFSNSLSMHRQTQKHTALDIMHVVVKTSKAIFDQRKVRRPHAGKRCK